MKAQALISRTLRSPAPACTHLACLLHCRRRRPPHPPCSPARQTPTEASSGSGAAGERCGRVTRTGGPVVRACTRPRGRGAGAAGHVRGEHLAGEFGCMRGSGCCMRGSGCCMRGSLGVACGVVGGACGVVGGACEVVGGGHVQGWGGGAWNWAAAGSCCNWAEVAAARHGCGAMVWAGSELGATDLRCCCVSQ